MNKVDYDTYCLNRITFNPIPLTHFEDFPDQWLFKNKENSNDLYLNLKFLSKNAKCIKNSSIPNTQRCNYKITIIYRTYRTLLLIFHQKEPHMLY